MSDYHDLQRRASEAGLYKPGMTKDDIRAALGETEDRDESTDRGRADERVVQLGRRRDRTPMGGFRQKIKVPYPQEGWYYHCFLDQDDKIMRAIDAGFVPVLQSDPEFGGTGQGLEYGDEVPLDREGWAYVTGNRRTGTPVKQFYMKQRKEFHEEDQAYKQRQIDDTEQGIRNHEQRTPEGDTLPEDLTYGEFNQFQR